MWPKWHSRLRALMLGLRNFIFRVQGADHAVCFGGRIGGGGASRGRTGGCGGHALEGAPGAGDRADLDRHLYRRQRRLRLGTSNHTNLANGITSGDFDIKGGIAGITYGGNWQAGHVVLGFESDYDWTDIKGTGGIGTTCGAGCFTNTKWLSTERMRAGWDFNGWLLYGTAGAAFARVDAGIVGCTPCVDKTRTGWAAGVGVETMFWQNWSAKLEYLHYDLGDSIHWSTPVPQAVTVLDRGDIIRAGINYHFDLINLLGGAFH